MQKYLQSQTLVELGEHSRNLISQPGFRRTINFGIVSTGFTIVELLIAIVIIGILASIVVVAYNGVTQSAQKSAITAELNGWAKLFEAYKAVNGYYPAPAANPLTDGGPGSSVLNVYCLGTGFPQVSGVGYCQQLSSTSSYRIAESTGTVLMTALSTVGSPPKNSKKYTYESNTGPFVRYYSNNIRLEAIYPGGTVCPSGMTNNYSNPNRTHCEIILTL